MLKVQATNRLGTAEAELELFAGINSGTTSGSGRERKDPGGNGRNGTALPDGGEEEDDEGVEANGVSTGLSITRIATGGNDLPMSFVNDRLIAYLQAVADENRQYAQFIMEYEAVSRNGIPAGFFTRTADILLEVGYH